MVTAELFGPMGAGKSTLYKALLTKARGKQEWVGALEKKSELVWKEKYRESRLAGFLYWMLSLHPKARSSVIKRMQPASLWPAMEASKQRWEPLIRYVLYDLEEGQAPLVETVRRHGWFSQALFDRIYLEARCQSDSRVLIDEGLIQRGIAFSLMQRDPEKTLSEYLERMPAPSVAIHATAPIDSLVERVSSRDGQDARLLKYVGEARELAMYAAAKLQQQGAQVVDVSDAGLSAETVAAHLAGMTK